MDMNVVVVDDSADVVLLLERIVQRIEGVHARGFTDPIAALAWVNANPPDLVFVDYLMPGLDGLAFLRCLRAMFGRDDIPVVMVTASEDDSVCQQALDCGATDFLAKPVRAPEFIARTRNLLHLRASARSLADRAQWLQSEVRKATAEVERREQEMLFSLGRAAEFRDPETGAHIQRMANYSRLVAERMGLSQEARLTILRAAPMHDIGKLGVPDDILLKPGKLTPEEFEVMKRHPLHGYEMLRRSESPVIKAGATIALSHHEKWDGTGYPRGLSGTAIPLYGRIVAVADVFDALTSVRPYKTAWDLDRAAAFLRQQSGRHFDPGCVQAFFAAWEEVLEIREGLRDTDEPVTNVTRLAQPVPRAA